MRDVQNYPKSGAYYFRYQQYDNNGILTYDVTNPYSTISGQVMRGRSDIVKSNHITATPYRAHRVQLSSRGTAFAKKTVQLSKARNEYVYYGERPRPPIGSALDYLSVVGDVVSPVVPYSVTSEAHNRLLSKIRNGSFNAALALAEFRESAQLAIDTVCIALRVAIAVRRGNWAQAYSIITGGKPIPKSAANAYAVTTWGWKPLISDVASAMKLLEGQMDRPDLVKESVTVVKSFSHKPVTGNWKITGNWEVGCRMGVRFGIQYPTIAMLSSLGFTNPVALAWELIPLSFVINWFVSIGTFLSNMSATLGLNFLGGYRTEFVRAQNVNWEYRVDVYSYDNLAYDTGQIEAFAMQRTPLLDWPEPRITFNTDLNTGQLIGLLALATQRASL